MEELNNIQKLKLIGLLDNDCWEQNQNYRFTEVERNEMIEDNNVIIEMLGGKRWKK